MPTTSSSAPPVISALPTDCHAYAPISAAFASKDTPRASVRGIVTKTVSPDFISVPGASPLRYAEPAAEIAIVGTVPPLLSGEAVKNFGSPV